MYKTFLLKNEPLKYCSFNLERVHQDSKFKKWLQKILIQLMFKLNLIQDEQLTVPHLKEVTITFDKIYEMLDEKITNEIYQRYHRSEDFILLIGRDYMHKLSREDYDEQLNFLLPCDINGSMGRMYKDLEVIILPDFKGLTLIKKSSLSFRKDNSYNDYPAAYRGY